jgi:hypothetical protein
MKIRTSLQILLLFIGLTTCQKEKIANRQYPRVKTLQVTEINESGAKFNAEIFSGNLQDIEEYGFIWNSGDKVVSREPIQNKSFSFTVHSALKKGTTYEVKAYVKTQTYEVFGPPVTFISLGSEAPVITDFDKKSGTWGDTITITGKNFRYKKEEVRVQLGDLYISVLSSTDTTIKIIVPFSFYSNSEKTNIRVTIEGNTATSTDQFTYLKPQITSIHPLLGTFNDTIEITGNNFSISRDTNVNKISFNGMAGEIVYATRSKLKVLVPVNLSSKVSNISIPGPLANTIFGNPFILKDMIISGFEPDTVFHLNDEITIKGQNFNPIPQNTSILLKGKLAQVIEASSNQLKVRFPSEIITNQSISMMDTAKITVKTQLQNINTSKALQIWYKSRWTKLRDFPGYNTVELPALGINDKGYVGCKELGI